MTEALPRPDFDPTQGPEAGQVVTVPTVAEINGAEQLAASQTPLNPVEQPTVAAEYVGRHRAPETSEIGRHRAYEEEARNPDRFITRTATRVATLADRIGTGASERRTTKEFAGDQVERGRELGRKVGHSIVSEVVATKNDFMDNLHENAQTVKEIGRDGVAAVKGFFKKRYETAVQRKAQLLEKGQAAWETTKRTGKKAGKVALVGAGVAIALPVAATGAAAYGVYKGGESLYKGGERVAKAAKNEYDEFKVSAQREWHQATVDRNNEKHQKHLDKAERKAAKVAAAREKLTKLQ